MMGSSRESRRRLRHFGAIGALVVLALMISGCMSLSTNVAWLGDIVGFDSHLGTPYSGVRVDLHFLFCGGRWIREDPKSLIILPVAIFPLLDLPFSAVMDTILLPADFFVEAKAPPLVPGRASCRVGM
jgi:uncharacterized protein YceK